MIRFDIVVHDGRHGPARVQILTPEFSSLIWHDNSACTFSPLFKAFSTSALVAELRSQYIRMALMDLVDVFR